MKYLYYPGCSLKGTARDYEESLLAIAPALGITLEELREWTCCGSSAAKSKDREWAQSLTAGTLAQAGQEDLDVLLPCSACYANHLQLVKKVQEDEPLRERLSLGRIPKVKHLLEVLAWDLGPEEIGGRIARPLKGMRVLPYYGCLVARPYPLGGRESRENPGAMEGIIRAVAAEPLPFPAKVDCCGGALLFSNEKVALKLTGKLLLEAKKLSPDCVAVACPLCHFMLDAKQRAVERELGTRINIPVLYITQLIGLALGISPERLGLHRLITSPAPLLNKLSRTRSAQAAI